MLRCHCDKCDRNCVNRKEPAESWKRHSAFTIPHCFWTACKQAVENNRQVTLPIKSKALWEWPLWIGLIPPATLRGVTGRRPRGGRSPPYPTAAGWDSLPVPDTGKAKKRKGQINFIGVLVLLVSSFILGRTKKPSYSQCFRYVSTKSFKLTQKYYAIQVMLHSVRLSFFRFFF